MWGRCGVGIKDTTMSLNNLQTFAVVVVLSIFIIWSLAQIFDDLLFGNRGVTVPDQFWGLLGIVLGSLLYALRYRKNGKESKKEPNDEEVVG